MRAKTTRSVVHSESTTATQSAPTHALELAHALAFRNGLGHLLYADGHTKDDITAGDIRDLHSWAVSNPSSVAVLGTGISTESLAKLFKTAVSAHKASAKTPSFMNAGVNGPRWATKKPAKTFRVGT
jgi:ubiquinol-cytochrome c reductase core subunit 2